MPYLASSARTAARVPAGHPEAYVEAFANIYRAFAEAVASGLSADPGFGTLDEAMRTMRFLSAAKMSSDAGGLWTEMIDA